MKAKELTNLSREELHARLQTMETEYYAAREAVRQGREKNHAKLKGLKRDIARVLTCFREKFVT